MQIHQAFDMQEDVNMQGDKIRIVSLCLSLCLCLWPTGLSNSSQVLSRGFYFWCLEASFFQDGSALPRPSANFMYYHKHRKLFDGCVM